MQTLENRPDGTVLAILTPEEAARLSDAPPANRKWAVETHTYLPGVYASVKEHQHVVHATTREAAEAEGSKRALSERSPGAKTSDVGAKDVTGKTQGFFGNWR